MTLTFCATQNGSPLAAPEIDNRSICHALAKSRILNHFTMSKTAENSPSQPRNQLSSYFAASHAFLIAIEDYDHLTRLQTPVSDVQLLAEVLQHEAHDYTIHPLVLNPDKAELEIFLSQTLPALVKPDDRVLLYFAGHGIALDEENIAEPKGFLLPRDAQRNDTSSFLPMEFLNDQLHKLPCRHLLLMLDCCFAGSFQWSNTRTRGIGFDHLPKYVYRQRFEYFVQEPAWQVVTSAAYNQKASDVVNQYALGKREENNAPNSPFTLALVEALRDGAGDLVPHGGDGLMTLSEVFSYVQDRLAQCQSANTQKPACFPLPKHRQGEFLFLNPQKQLFLTEYKDENNPYRGLQAYEPENQNSFYGRERVISELRERLNQTNFLVVSGTSGSGKSSVVKAGLLPALAGDGYVYSIIRPGAYPLASLTEGLAALQSARTGNQAAAPAVLVVDQFEEIITQCVNKDEREVFYLQLLDLLTGKGPVQKVIVTVRADFDPAFEQTVLREVWHPARYIIPVLNFSELQEIIVQPASERCLHFDTGLVDELVKSVLNTPGGLPLLSFTLMELYDRFVKRWAAGDTNRTLTRADFQAIGGVEGSLRQKADALYTGFDTASKNTMQNLLLRMVAITGSEYAGKRVLRRDLVFNDPVENGRMDIVVQALEEARLLVSGKADQYDDAYVEPAHDALVRAWPQLLDWIAERGADNVVLQNRLNEAVNDYEFAKGGLWSKDPRLELLRAELLKSNSWINQRERIFIEESVSKAILEIEELEKQRDEAIRQRNVAEKNMRAATNTALVLRTAKADPTLALRIADYNLRQHPENAAGYSLFHDIISDPAQVFYQQTLKAGDAVAYIFVVAFSPDGKTILTGSRDKKARLWSRDGHLIHTFDEHKGTINSAAFSPDGKLLLTGSADNTAKIWSTDGQLLLTLSEHQKAVTSVAFSSDGKLILTGSNDKTAKIWSHKGHVLTTLTGHDDMVNAIAFSPDDKTILTGSDDRTAKLWSLDGQILANLNEHEGHITSVAFSPDGAALLTGSGDRSAKLWSVDGKLLHTFNAHRDVVKSVAFSSDGKRILTGSQDWTAKVWTLEGRVIATLIGHQSSVESAAFSPPWSDDSLKGQLALTGSLDGMTKRWSLDGLLVSNFEGHSEGLSSVAYSPDGTKVLTGSYDKTAKIWTNDGKLIAEFKGEQGAVYACAFSPDGNWIVTGNWDKTAKLWSVKGSPEVIFTGHEDKVTSVAFSPDGKTILTGSRDKTAKIWSLDGKVITTIIGNAGPVLAVAFSPDGKTVITGSGGDNTVKIWSLDGRLIQTLARHSNVVLAVAFSPDGQTILSGSSDDTAIHWSLDGQILAILKGHEIGVNAVAFSPDGKTLATASNDDTAKLWSPNGQLLTTLTGHKGYVTAIVFSPDGATILTASSDKTAKCWMMPQTFLAERVQKFSFQEFHDAGVQLEPDDLAKVQPEEKEDVR